jgi:GT2 family glycosyltransferase
VADVTAVVANYNGATVLRDCLESLRRQTAPPAEVIVVDGGSTDGSDELAAAHGARWIAEQNNGLGYLYNRGIDASRSELVLLANNDIALDERCLELLAEPLETDASLFAADPRQVAWDGERLVHARATLRRGPLLRELVPGFVLDLTAPADEPVWTVTANAGCMLVRREMLLELGGFDETFFLDFEDVDLCWRAWLRGWGSVYVPDAWLRHHVGAANTAELIRFRIASSHHNLVRFALKCLPALDALRVVAAELIRVPRHGGLVAAPLLQILRELPEILRRRRRSRPTAELLTWLLAGQPADRRPPVKAIPLAPWPQQNTPS